MLRGLQQFAEILSIRKKGDLMIHQIRYLGRVANAVSWYPFGVFANPTTGSLARLIFMRGQGEQRIVVPSSTGAPDSEETECGMYHPATGTKVHFKANGDLDIETASGKKVNVVCGELNIKTDTMLLQDAGASDDVLQIVNDLALALKDAEVSHSGDQPMNTTTQNAAQAIADRAITMRS